MAGLARAEKVAETGGGSDPDAEGKGVEHLIDSHDDALCSERKCAETTGGEGHDFEGPPLRSDVQDAGDG